MQTIPGSGGAIGVELAKALRQYTNDVRLASRAPERVHPDDHPVSADLTKSSDAIRALEDSEIAYLTVGLPYDTKVWKETWPLVMSNVIEACKRHRTKLVFFDNVYMYDPDHLDAMTEETPINPQSEKGRVRARIAGMIMDEVRGGGLNALIARSADFYGPAVRTSVLTETVFNNLASGKKANWLGSASCGHSFTFTPDAGKATALLGNTADAYNQVWHLPTADDPFTGEGWVDAIAGELRVEPKYREVPKFMVRLMGLFVPMMRELVEMMYQYDRDYVFDSGKFERRFNVAPTPYLEGIRIVIESDYDSAGARA